MSTAADTHQELGPLRTDFDLVWRGYDPDQVKYYVHNVETDVRLLTVDRDAAIARAEDLARQLEAARTRIDELTRRIDSISRRPIEPDALTERLRRMAELAHEKAAEITARARAAAEHTWTTTSEAADRMRDRAERLVTELDRRRREMETEHRRLMDQAQHRIETMTRAAEQRRRELDEQSARLRRQVESDFEMAMAARRTEAMRALADQERAAKECAERTVEAAREHRRRVAGELRAVRQLLADAEPLLRPVPGEKASA